MPDGGRAGAGGGGWWFGCGCGVGGVRGRWCGLVAGVAGEPVSAGVGGWFRPVLDVGGAGAAGGH